AGLRSAGVSGVLDGVPAGLQEQALLWVEKLRLGRRDVEEERIEQFHTVEEPTPSAVGLARCSLHLVEVGTVVPASSGYLGDAVPALTEVPPEGVEIGRLRVPSGEPDDGDRLGLRGRAGPRAHRFRYACGPVTGPAAGGQQLPLAGEPSGSRRGNGGRGPVLCPRRCARTDQ